LLQGRAQIDRINTMKPSSSYFFGAMAAAALLTGAALAALPDGAAKEEVVPLIVIDDVPLTMAIRNLARQMNINFILDPRVPGSGFAAGDLVPEPSVSIRRENATTREVLNDLLQRHGLELIANPATTIARIAPTNLAVKPIRADPALIGTNEVYPLVVLDDVSLADALRDIARRGFKNITIDPRSTEPSFGRGGTVKVRWEQVTSRQALAAVMDNCDLMLNEDATTSSVVIRLKPSARGEPEKRQR